MHNTWLLIFGMFIVTFIPRMLPMLIKNIHFPNGLNKWLSYIPYAVLGALIFPGIMGAHPDSASYGIIAGIVAILLAWFQKQLLLVVAGSLVTMFILQTLSI